MLAHIVCKQRRRLKGVGSRRYGVLVNLRLLPSLVEATSTTRVTASLTNVRQRKVTKHRLLMLGQLGDVERGRVLLPGNQRQRRMRSNVGDHAHRSAQNDLRPTSPRRRRLGNINRKAVTPPSGGAWSACST